MTALGDRDRAPARARRHPAGTGSQLALLAAPAANSGALDGVIVVRDQPEGMGPVQRATGSAAGNGADARDHGDAECRRSESRPRRHRTVLGLLLPGQRTLQRRRHRHGRGAGGDGLRDARRRRAASASRGAPTGCCRTCWRPGAEPIVYWIGFPLSIALALAMLSRRGRGGCGGRAGAGRTTGAPWLAFPLGAVAGDSRRWSRSPRSPSSTTAPISNCSTPNCAAGSPT